MARKLILTLEFLILFFGIPFLIFLNEDFLHPSMLILPVLVFIFLVLKRTTDFQWKELVKWGIPHRTLAKHGIISILIALLMFGYIFFFENDHLFDLPGSHPWIYLAMCLFYPVFSAYGQEVIYRTFLFRRYGDLFGSGWLAILASGVAFSFLHIVYYDPVSIILTFMGGIYFARVYQQTHSVLFSAALHGLMGIILFGVGLGRYFWLDMPL